MRRRAEYIVACTGARRGDLLRSAHGGTADSDAFRFPGMNGGEALLEQFGVRFAGESNRGLVMERNEDNFFWVARRGDRAALAAVADGVGGCREGDVASFVCCRRMLGAWQKLDTGRLTPDGAADFLRRVLDDVNAEFCEHNCGVRDGTSLATTVAAAVFFSEDVVIAHAGDSRVYRYLPGEGLAQLTEDHSLQAVMDRGGPDAPLPAGASGNWLYRSVGSRRRLRLDSVKLPRAPLSRYLLCSDGISRSLDAGEISGALRDSDDPAAAVNRLMRAALLAGGRDNITLICAFPGRGR